MMEEECLTERVKDGLRALRLEMEAARFEADRAFRQYNAVDPENRVVARELEKRWNAALANLEDVQKRISLKEKEPKVELSDKEILTRLAADLSRLWLNPSTDIGVKKRIIR